MIAHSFLKKLVDSSYSGLNLDQQQVKAIADRLSHKELKVYYRALKQREMQHTVIVTSAVQVSEKNKNELETVFADKNVTFNTDPTLLLGVKIQNNDTIYQMNLQNTFATMSQYIQEAYE